MCLVEGCTRPHKAVDHRPERKSEFAGGTGPSHSHAENFGAAGYLSAAQDNLGLWTTGRGKQGLAVPEAEPLAPNQQFLWRPHLFASGG